MVGRRYVVGVVSAMRMIYQVSGVKGYSKGITARMLISAPGAAVSWTVYEFFKHFL